MGLVFQVVYVTCKIVGYYFRPIVLILNVVENWHKQLELKIKLKTGYYCEIDKLRKPLG
jgi:hypothetical protein